MKVVFNLRKYCVVNKKQLAHTHTHTHTQEFSVFFASKMIPERWSKTFYQYPASENICSQEGWNISEGWKTLLNREFDNLYWL
jgi:hypothetical protein